MSYIFLDESGDLGFSKGSSSCFIFTAIFTNDGSALERVIKTTRRGLQKKYKKVRELHAYHAKENTRRKVLQHIAGLQDIGVFCIVLKKEKVPWLLQDNKDYLYKYVAMMVLRRIFSITRIPEKDLLQICIDKKDTNKNMQKVFENALLDLLLTKHKKISIHLRSSHEEKGLQAADFVSWALFRKYQQNDNNYYDIIKHKILDETMISPKSKKASRFTKAP